MENTFRYEGQRLYADVSVDMLPKAVSLIKGYLASRLYSEEERREDSMDFLDRTLKSMPDQVARNLSDTQINKIFAIREIGLQVHQRVYGEIAAIPEDSSYQGEINITRGYRPGNVAKIKVEKNREGKAHIELYFDSQCGDETRPLRWMQYDALLSKAKEAGFSSDRGSIDQEVEAFRVDDSTYFRTGPIDEIMSAFDWSELEAAVHFLWSEELPEDIRRKLGR